MILFAIVMHIWYILIMPFVTIFFNERAFKVQESVAVRLLRFIDIFADEYSNDDAIARLKTFKCSDKVIENIKNHPSIKDDVFRILDDMVLNHRSLIEDYLGNIELLAIDNSTISIPNEFKHVSNIDSDGTGKGEALLAIILKNDVKWLPPGDAYDFIIDGQAWHFKDHRNAQSTPMGRPKGSEEFYETPIMKFIKSTGINIFTFGTDDFRNNPKFEDAIIKRYGASLEESAIAFEKELNSEFQASKCVAGSAGVLYLENDASGNMLIRRVDVKNIMFHSNSGRGFKACCLKNRFVDAIMSRTRKEELLKREKAAKAAKKASRELATWHVKQGNIIAKQFNDIEKIVIKEQRNLFKQYLHEHKKKCDAKNLEQERMKKAMELCEVAKHCLTLVQLSKQLNVSSSTIEKRKKDAIAFGLEFRLKSRGIKHENRNSRRSPQTMHEGPLGIDQASVS